MQALRQRGACTVRRIQPSRLRTVRTYASEGHGHDHHHAASAVEEGLGTAFYVAAGIIPASLLVYNVSRPAQDGESSGFSKLISSWTPRGDSFQAINDVRTQIIEQAAHDKHLLYGVPKSTHVELKFPEVFQTGSPRAVPAGSRVNVDAAMEKYREEARLEEEAVAKRMAAREAARDTLRDEQ